MPMQRSGRVTLAHLQGDHARPAPVPPIGDAAGLLQVLRHQGVPQRVEERRPQLAVPDLHQVEEALHPCSRQHVSVSGQLCGQREG